MTETEEKFVPSKRVTLESFELILLSFRMLNENENAHDCKTDDKKELRRNETI
jgi:hypothetical protein